MQEFLFLLALSAAAGFYSSAAPTDHYLTEIQSYWKLPEPRCFRFTPYVSETWFQDKFYDDILKHYPGERSIELNDEEFKVECAKKLRNAALEIHKNMEDHKKQWMESVMTETNKAITTYRRKIDEFTHDYTKDVPTDTKTQIEDVMNKQSDAFDQKVSEMITVATGLWKSVHDKIHVRLLSFHEKMLNTAVNAFKLRQKKIEEFSKVLDKGISNFIIKYQRSLVEEGRKNISAYGQLQFKIFGLNSTTDSSTTIGNSIRAGQLNYQVLYWKDVRNKMTRYRKRLQSNRDKLIKYYKSSYQIITCTGKLNFDRKRYANFRKTLGEWWKADDKDGKPYNYREHQITWKEPEYKDLISGNASAVNDPVSQFKERTSLQGEDAMKKATKVFTAWKRKWRKIHSDLCKEYFKIVTERHQLLLDGFKGELCTRYRFWCARFQARFDAYKRNLIRRRLIAMRKYSNTLRARLENGCTRFRENLEKYKSAVKSHATKAINAYNDCMETRGDKIEEYEKLMITKRQHERKNLHDKLLQTGLKKCGHYEDFLCYYHGEKKTWDKSVIALLSYYKDRVNKEMHAISERFDQFWTSLLPKLVNHYECTYKCVAKTDLNIPEFTYDIKWKISRPTSDTYPFHIKYFKKYRHYTLKSFKGKYHWSK